MLGEEGNKFVCSACRPTNWRSVRRWKAPCERAISQAFSRASLSYRLVRLQHPLEDPRAFDAPGVEHRFRPLLRLDPMLRTLFSR